MIEALVLTVILEWLALVILGERDKLFYLYWVAVTALTNVLVNLYLTYLFSGGVIEYWINVTLLEIMVLISEFFLCFLYTLDKKKSIKYSAVCNSASFLIGLLIQNIFL